LVFGFETQESSQTPDSLGLRIPSDSLRVSGQRRVTNSLRSASAAVFCHKARSVGLSTSSPPKSALGAHADVIVNLSVASYVPIRPVLFSI
jgi:hypothetical protein